MIANKTKDFFNVLKKSMFYKMFIYIILPVLITFFINICINIFYSRQLQESAIEQQKNSLNMVSNYVNETLQQVLNSSNLLSLNEAVTNIMYRNDSSNSENIAETYTVLEVLRRYKGSSKFISGVALVDRNTKRVVANLGKSSMQQYFNEFGKYEDYSFMFWDNFKIPAAGYMILAPTRKSETDRTVIPLVASGFQDIVSNNIMIIDIDCQEISDMFLKTEANKYGKMYIYDPETKVSMGAESPSKKLFGNEEFLELLNQQQSFHYKFNGDEYLVIRSVGEKGLFSRYIYVSIIPLKVLFHAYDASRTLITAICFFTLFLIMVLTYWFSKVLYTPIQKMKNQLISTSLDSEYDKQNELEFIDKQLKVVIDMNKNMKLQLQTVLPLVCEQYLLKMLNYKDDISDSDIDRVLYENGIVFEEDYFIAITIKLRYTEKFYEHYNHEQYVETSSQLYDLFQMVFNELYNSILISSRKDSFILIVNVKDNDKCFDNTIGILVDTVKAFETDKELLKVNIGVGNAYTGYEGMRQSYNESQNVSILQMTSEHSDLIVYSANCDISGYVSYTIDDENKLFNCIVKGAIEEVNKVIQMIVDNNLKQGINQIGIKHLYQQIYNTAVKVLQVKGITEDSLMQEKYMDINLVGDMMDIETITEYINQFVMETVSYSNLSVTKRDMKGIIEFIDQNFESDIYLETIAQQFNISSKYLSRLIKNYLGISFGDYLARLRIDKSKILLADTDFSINDIIEKSGFNNRNTFIRTFKKQVGMVPSEYRNHLLRKS